jgi:leucyl aminopeptidase (aminopeptidase T)
MTFSILAAGGAGAVGAAAAGRVGALDYPALARRIVAQLALQPGEKVLLVAYPGMFSELVTPLRYEVIRAGGVDLGCWTVLPPAPVALSLETGVAAKAVAASRAALRERLRDVDAAVMLPGATPAHPEYAAMEDVLHEGRGRTVHFHWLGGGAPSALALPDRSLPPVAVIDEIYQRAVLHSDCKAIGEVQRRFAAALRTGEVRVTTPRGTDLRWRAGDRPVNFQDGDASAARAGRARVLVDREIEIPCGALRVAPVEESVHGTLVFPPAVWNGRQVAAVKLSFASGKVTEIAAEPGPGEPATRAAAEAELTHGGPAAHAFREFALGFNPELAVPAATPFIPYYGYGAGVVRLSLGDNSELGGQVRGPYVRWNFFADATVTVDGKAWVRDGKLLPPP